MTNSSSSAGALRRLTDRAKPTFGCDRAMAGLGVEGVECSGVVLVEVLKAGRVDELSEVGVARVTDMRSKVGLNNVYACEALGK